MYVDDLLVCGKTVEIVDSFLKYLKKEFNNITVNEGIKQSYLGMTFTLDYGKKMVRATMGRYVEDVVSSINNEKGSAKTPATSDLFDVDTSALGVTAKEQKDFHSMVAKLLYLAKRVRPDILTTVSFLATRVKEPNQQDLSKLSRLIRYIRGTVDYGIELTMEDGKLDAFVDASHCVHAKDGKSQTGVYVTIGTGPIFVRSSKQKLVAKSSTEAELVAISDSLPQIIWIREFMLEQRILSPGTPATIQEDNQSTIALIKKGRPAAESTRHINIRHFFVSDRCNHGEVKVVYVPTENQIADFFTKGLVGRLFYKLRSLIVREKAEANNG